MNRPNIKDYMYLEDTIRQFKCFQYSQDMEKYCDKLERAVSKLSNVLQATSGFYLKDNKLQSHYISMYEWEKWAMKDE